MTTCFRLIYSSLIFFMGALIPFSTLAMDVDNDTPAPSAAVQQSSRFAALTFDNQKRLVEEAVDWKPEALDAVLGRVRWKLMPCPSSRSQIEEWRPSLEEIAIADHRWVYILMEYPDILAILSKLLKDIEQKASLGSAEDQYLLGWMCSNSESKEIFGDYLNYNPKKAGEFMAKAAGQEYAPALFHLYSLNPQESSETLLIQSAEKEYPPANHALANLLSGRGEAAAVTAERHSSIAAWQGYIPSQKALSHWYAQQKEGMNIDAAIALYWLSENTEEENEANHKMLAKYLFKNADHFDGNVFIGVPNSKWKPDIWKNKIDAVLDELGKLIKWLESKENSEFMSSDYKSYFEAAKLWHEQLKNFFNLKVSPGFLITSYMVNFSVYSRGVDCKDNLPRDFCRKTYYGDKQNRSFTTIGFDNVKTLELLNPFIALPENIGRGRSQSNMGLIWARQTLEGALPTKITSELESAQVTAVRSREEIKTLLELIKEDADPEIQKLVDAEKQTFQAANTKCSNIEAVLGIKKYYTQGVDLIYEWLFDGQAQRNLQFAQSALGKGLAKFCLDDDLEKRKE